MACRILFEDEITETGLSLNEANRQNSIKNITVKLDNKSGNDEDHTDQIDDIEDKRDQKTGDENCEEEANNNQSISGESHENKSCEIKLEHVQVNMMQTDDQVLGNGNQINDVLDKTGQSPEEKRNDKEEEKVTKIKSKKKPSELEKLGIDVKVNDEAPQNKYDVFGDESNIYRKYKLRKSEQKISYKEPNDWKYLRRFSSDDEKKTLSCTSCLVDFDSQRALQLHVRTHGTVLEYKCALCSEKFTKNADLIAHKTTHDSESFVCEKCKLAFSDHSDFLLHNLTHTIQLKFKCPECGLYYKKNSYKIHILTHFDRKLKCPICRYVVNGEYNLKNHMNQHQYNFTCVECGKKCNSKKTFEYHMGMHTGVKKYQCLYCGKCFASISMRQVHTRIHTGETPYTCDICGHKSRQSGDMKRHKITHETEKKFACEHCNKKFFYKPDMVTHMRRHTKTSLYECPECDSTFTSTAGLKTHALFKHLTERPVECKLCNAKFINDNQFKKHTKSKYHKRNTYGSAMKEIMKKTEKSH